MFLTSAMATNTMLYIGFSFADAYLNEFRAEVVMMLRPQPHLPAQYDTVLAALNKIGKAGLLSRFYEAHTNDDHFNLLAAPDKASLTRKFMEDKEIIRKRLAAIPDITSKDVADIETFMKGKAFSSGRRPIDLPIDPETPAARPIAYAIIDGKTPQQIDYYKRHEGVQFMTWKTAGSWFGGLDMYLHSILRRTSRPFLWGELLDEVKENDRVIVTWDLDHAKPGEEQHKDSHKRKVWWWLEQCYFFFKNSSRHMRCPQPPPPLFFPPTLPITFPLPPLPQPSTMKRTAALAAAPRPTGPLTSTLLPDLTSAGPKP